MNYIEIKEIHLPELSEMYAETFNMPPWNDKWTIETASLRLRQMIRCEEAYGLMAENDGLICGMMLGAWEQFYTGKIFSIKEFCVRNDMRRQGIGSKLLEESEYRLRQLGISEIMLYTHEGRHTQGFYQSQGYKKYEGMIMMGKIL